MELQATEQRRASASGGGGGPSDDAPGATFGQLDLVATEIAAGDADVVSLQEVHRDDLPRLIELLADRHGLDYHVEFQEALSETDERLAENVDPTRRNPFGNAVLSLAPLTSLDGGALPFDGREPRAFQVEQTTIEGREVTVVNTHLGLVDDERPAALEWLLGEVDTPHDRQTWEIFDVATEQDGPVIVTGDFNQRPGELAENARQFDLDGRVDVANDRDRATNRGGSVIDYVLVSPDIEPVDTDIEPGVSDHHSVTVEVELPD